MEEIIRDFAGRQLGIITTEPNGDKTARMWQSRMIVGYYRKGSDHTTDFSGKVVARGDVVVSLIYKALSEGLQ